jgi:hypothetical protein
MKTEILNSERITKEIVLTELNNENLSKEEIDEYLDIISAINEGQFVYSITTNIGEYLFFVKGLSIKDTREKYKKSK